MLFFLIVPITDKFAITHNVLNLKFSFLFIVNFNKDLLNISRTKWQYIYLYLKARNRMALVWPSFSMLHEKYWVSFTASRYQKRMMISWFRAERHGLRSGSLNCFVTVASPNYYRYPRTRRGEHSSLDSTWVCTRRKK